MALALNREWILETATWSELKSRQELEFWQEQQIIFHCYFICLHTAQPRWKESWDTEKFYGAVPYSQPSWPKRAACDCANACGIIQPASTFQYTCYFISFHANTNTELSGALKKAGSVARTAQRNIVRRPNTDRNWGQVGADQCQYQWNVPIRYRLHRQYFLYAAISRRIL